MAKQPDLSEFFKLSKPKTKPCAVAFAREQLDAASQEQLDAAVAENQGYITSAAIRKWLEARGHTVSDASVTVHRRRTCACGRAA